MKRHNNKSVLSAPPRFLMKLLDLLKEEGLNSVIYQRCLDFQNLILQNLAHPEDQDVLNRLKNETILFKEVINITPPFSKHFVPSKEEME